MLIVRVELWSAKTGRVKELARMKIWNAGGTEERADYEGETLRGRTWEALNLGIVQRKGKVQGYMRKQLHVWNLVSRMLRELEYR